MITIQSLIFELDNWSWGYTAKVLHNHLSSGFKIKEVEFNQWKKTRRKQKEDITFSQNISQLRYIRDLSKVICRLGGNMSFDDNKVIEEYTRNMSQCYAVVTTNTHLYSIAKNANPNTYMITNGIDLDKWKPVKNRTFDVNQPLIGFIGNIASPSKRDYKGYDYVVEACNQLGLNMTERLYSVNQLPHEEMIKKFWNKIDIFILPTKGEGCSNSIMEALACGVPVITTKEAGYHGEFCEDEYNILFCERNVESIVKKIKYLMAIPTRFYVIGGRGRLFAEIRHDINKIAAMYRDLFTQCKNNLNQRLK